MMTAESVLSTPLMLYCFFFLIITVFIFWFLFTKKSFPGPRGVPILGYLPFLQPDLHLQFNKLAQKYGPIFKLKLGTKLCFVVDSPELMKQIHRENDAVFANRDPPIAALIATGGLDILWAPNGVYWREVRKLFVRETLSTRNLQSSYSLRREEIRKSVRKLKNQVGNRVEIGEIIFDTQIEVVTSLLWGPDLGAQKWPELRNEFRSKMAKLVDLLGKPNISDFFPILAKLDLQGIAKEMRKLVREVEKILDFVINERMIQRSKKENDDQRDVLECLLELIGREIGGLTFGVQQIKALLLDMITAGTDTTSTVVEWVMTELLVHPKIMDEVVEELMRVVGVEQVVEESHIHELHYLEAVVKETLRIHPLLPLLVPRSPCRSCIIGGYEIPAGSRVFLNVWSVQMDPNLWDNPSEFKPERFLDADSDKYDFMGSSFKYLPFGVGRRICPGLPLAERMLMHLIATLVHTFGWRVPDGETIDRKEMFGIVMRKQVPLVAVPYPRLQFMAAYT